MSVSTKRVLASIKWRRMAGLAEPKNRHEALEYRK